MQFKGLISLTLMSLFLSCQPVGEQSEIPFGGDIPVSEEVPLSPTPTPTPTPTPPPTPTPTAPDVLVGDQHTLHFDLQRIALSPDPGDGCYQVSVNTMVGQIFESIFEKDIAKIVLGTPTCLVGSPQELQLAFDVVIPALKCAVPECTLTILVRRIDSLKVNYEVNPASVSSDTAIVQSGPDPISSSGTKKFVVIISNPGK